MREQVGGRRTDMAGTCIGRRSDILPPWRRQSDPSTDGRASRCADRRRRLCRPGARHRAAPGARRSVHGDGRRSGARHAATPATRAPRRSRRRRGGCSRPSASGTRSRTSAQPILDMVVTDSKLQDAVRPTFLTFGGEVAPGEPFAHMIENPALVAALIERAKADGVELRADAVTGFEAGAGSHRRAAVATATRSRAQLLVAADGARSAIREAAGIRSVGWDYDQSGIVTTVAHERDHQRPRRGAFPAGRAVRDPAAEGQALVDRVDRGEARGRAHRRAAGRRIPRRAGKALRPASRRDRSGRAAPRLSARAVDGALVHRASGSRWSATPRM